MAGLKFVGLLRMARAARLRCDHHRYAVAVMVEGVRPGLVCLVALVAADADLRVAAGGPLLHGQRRGSALVAGNACLAFLGRTAGKLGDVRCCRCATLCESGSYRQGNSAQQNNERQGPWLVFHVALLFLLPLFVGLRVEAESNSEGLALRRMSMKPTTGGRRVEAAVKRTPMLE